MAVRIVGLSGGGASLGFDPEDLPKVHRAITVKYGEVDLIWHRHIGTVSFGGETFTYADEWGELCLVSVTKSGARILQALAVGAE